MRYSRLSASFIFIAQDTRAQTNSENFPERLLTRIYVVVVVVGCCCCGAGSSSPGASSPAGQPVFAARHVSCLVDIYWRRLAAFPMMDFSANPTDRPTPPTRSVQTRNFTSPVPTSRFSSLLSFICRWCVPEKTTVRGLRVSFSFLLFNSFSRFIHY